MSTSMVRFVGHQLLLAIFFGLTAMCRVAGLGANDLPGRAAT